MPERRKNSRSDVIASVLKQATRRQVRAAGGIEAAASHTRVGKTEIAAYQSPNHGNRFIPVDVVADLTVATGSVDVIHTLTGLAGGVLLPAASEGDGLNLDLATFAERAAKVFRDFATVCGKEKLSEEEIARLDSDLDEAVRTAMHARALLRQWLKEGKSEPHRAEI